MAQQLWGLPGHLVDMTARTGLDLFHNGVGLASQAGQDRRFLDLGLQSLELARRQKVAGLPSFSATVGEVLRRVALARAWVEPLHHSIVPLRFDNRYDAVVKTVSKEVQSLFPGWMHYATACQALFDEKLALAREELGLARRNGGSHYGPEFGQLLTWMEIDLDHYDQRKAGTDWPSRSLREQAERKSADRNPAGGSGGSQ